MICSYSTPFKAGVGRHFDPRSPRGERRPLQAAVRRRNAISIHAPREGSDLAAFGAVINGFEFLSTLPARGATPTYADMASAIKFLSTLPARGATVLGSYRSRDLRDFYPRSPRGERHSYPRQPSRRTYFYPRSPRGERRLGAPEKHLHPNFYPRSPRGERPTSRPPPPAST